MVSNRYWTGKLPKTTFASFKRIAEDHLIAHLEKSDDQAKAGTLNVPDDSACLFPSIAVFTEMPTHFAFELFGARHRYKGLRSKRQSVATINQFLGDFSYDGPTEYICAPQRSESIAIGPCGMQNIILAAKRTIAELENRFPGVASLVGSGIVRTVPDGIDCIKAFDGSGLNYPLIVGNSLITNTLGNLVRARYTNLLVVVPIGLSARQLSEMLRANIPYRGMAYSGLQVVRSGSQEAIAQAGQFANLFLQGMQETTLTQFLEDHSEIIMKALRAEKLFFQPKFSWQEGNPDSSEESIQPDLIIRRVDGTWCVIDFKLPLLKHASVTTGGHRRRRFIQPIADGVAQLHNYREYFDYRSNRLSAAVKLGEEVRDPNLMIVVGNSENVDLVEVNEAMRALKPIDIMDYDAFIRLSLGKVLGFYLASTSFAPYISRFIENPDPPPVRRNGRN